MIHNVEQLIMQVEEGSLYETITYIGRFQGMEAFNVDTNGNDSYYAMHLFADKNTLYYSDASLTLDDIQRDVDNYQPLVDDFRAYEYDAFPFEEDELKRWIDDKVKEGVEYGKKAYEEWFDSDVIVEDVPERFLNYIINGEDDDLQEQDIRLIKRWMNDNDVQSVNPDFNKRDEFNASPAFGKPCTTVQCVIIKKG